MVFHVYVAFTLAGYRHIDAAQVYNNQKEVCYVCFICRAFSQFECAAGLISFAKVIPTGGRWHQKLPRYRRRNTA
jgi:hypothetical protein